MKNQVFCDHPKVEQMWSMNFSGNIIPMTWYKTITKQDGKPDMTAITLLSEIVYWYRPQEIRDEISGEFLGLRKRFHDDNYLQKGYQELADTFGFGYQEVRRAIMRLEDIGVIARVLQSVPSARGVLPNTLFIDLNVDRLAELTYQVPEKAAKAEPPFPDTNTSPDARNNNAESIDPSEDEQDPAQNSEAKQANPERHCENKTPLTPAPELSGGMDTAVHTSHQERRDVWTQPSTHPIASDGTPPSLAMGQLHRLHTESITTKSSSSESTSRFREEPDDLLRKKTIPKTNEQEQTVSHSRMKEMVHANIRYEELLLNEDKQLTDEIVRVMVDALCADQETIKVNGMEMPAGVVKSRLLKMTPQQIESVLENMRDVTNRIVNMPRYLLSALYNEATTPHHANQVMVNHILNA